MVIVLSPAADNLSRLGQIRKPVLVQAEIPELAVKAFNKSILSRLAWLDELQLHPGLFAPEEHRLGSESSRPFKDRQAADRLNLTTQQARRSLTWRLFRCSTTRRRWRAVTTFPR